MAWSKEHWRTLVEKAPEAIGVIVEGDLVFANAAMAQLLGTDAPEQLLGETLLQWVHPDQVPQVVERIRRLERGEAVPRNVVRFVRRDGQTITVESTAVHGTYEGRPAIQIMMRDITEQRKTRHDLQFQAKLLDAIGQSVIVTDTEGTITYWNRAAEEIFGWRADDVVGHNVLEVRPAEGMDEHAAKILDHLRQGTYWQGEFTLRRKDGSTFPGIVSNRPLFDNGHLTGTIGVTTDITRLKQTEETLRNRSRELETLLHVSRHLSEQLDLDVIFDRLVESVVAILPGADVAVLCFHEGEGSEPSVVASRTEDAAERSPLAPEVCIALAERIAQKQESTMLNAATMGEALPGEVQSMLGVPLFVAGTSVGGLMALSVSDGDAFTERHGRLLQSVASQASVAIHNARLFRERRRISIQLAQTQEAERHRIAQEFHDEVGALLTSLQLSLKLAHKQVTNPRARQEIEGARHEIIELADMVRRISLDLRPALLDEFGLIPALRDYLQRYRQQVGIEVHFQHEVPEHVHLHPIVATAAYRIVQEALTNVARYAGAPTAQVTLLMEPQVLRVHVIDEGRGFDVQAVWHREQTLGLTGMRERAALLGGTLDVQSTPGAGTRISASLPLEPRMF